MIFLFLSLHNSYFFTLIIQDEMKDPSQTSNDVEKRGNRKKIEFTSFTSNSTNKSNNTNCTMLTTGQSEQPMSEHSNVNSERTHQNTTALKKPHNLNLHLENGKVNKERTQETNIIQTDAQSTRIDTGVADYLLESRLVIIKIEINIRKL